MESEPAPADILILRCRSASRAANFSVFFLPGPLPWNPAGCAWQPALSSQAAEHVLERPILHHQYHEVVDLTDTRAGHASAVADS